MFIVAVMSSTHNLCFITKTRPCNVAIFHGVKTDETDDFQMKKVDRFLIFAQHIDRGYTLEPPQ